MTLTFTDAAIAALKERVDLQELSLFYATGPDCGCPSTGIFVLRVNEKDSSEYDAMIETNIGKIPAQKWALVYLDSENVIDFNVSQQTLQLKSERGFLNMNLIIEDMQPK